MRCTQSKLLWCPLRLTPLCWAFRFDNTLPRGSATQDYSGVTCICLGVPPSHGLTFPDALLRHAGYKNADPAQCDYRQVLEVKVSWSSLLQEGKELPAKELSSYLDTAF